MGSARSHRTPEHQADLPSPLVCVPDTYVFRQIVHMEPTGRPPGISITGKPLPISI
jgi:hypothetical protein